MGEHNFPWSLMVLAPVWVLGAMVFHWLEPRAPIVPRAKDRSRRGYVADLTAAIVDGPVMSAGSKIAACYVILLMPQVYEVLERWPWLLQFAVFFLVNDFARYWLHRWHHTVPVLWRIHRVHHSPVDMDAMSNFRVHVLEAMIKYGLVVFPFHLLGINNWVIVTYSIVDMLKGYWHHANLRTYVGPLNYLLNSAEQHWWHHVSDRNGRFVNFGSTLSIWDRLFGTFYWKPGEWPDAVGLHGMERFPSDYLGQLTSIVYSEDEAVRRFHGPETIPAADFEAVEAEGVGDAKTPTRAAPEPVLAGREVAT